MANPQDRKPNAPFCWQEKNNLRHVRALVKKNLLKRSEGRNILDIFRAITEMMSDAGSDVLVGTNLAKKLASYALMGHSTAKQTLALMEFHKIISVNQIRESETGRYSSAQIQLLHPPQRELDVENTAAQNPTGGGKPDGGNSNARETRSGDSDPLIEESLKSTEEVMNLEENDSLASSATSTQTQKSSLGESRKGTKRFKKISREKLQQHVDKIIHHLGEMTGRQYDAHNHTTRDLRVRLRQGASVDDCILIIDHRFGLWFKDTRMTGYLRPQTLFAENHFDDYLQLAREWSQSGRPTLHPSAHRDAEEVAPSGPRRETMIRQWQQLSK